MLLNEMFGTVMESDHEHAQALRATGFWGAQGAGCVFFAKATGRFMLAHRASYNPKMRGPEQPDTYGTWGGAIDRGEDPLAAVKREAVEETGYRGTVEAVIPLYVFTKGSFRYSNFVAVVPEEFTPKLDWENQGWVWCEFGDWPQPLHFGMKALLNDAESLAVLRKLAGEQE